MALADMLSVEMTGAGAAMASPDALFHLGLQYAIGRGVEADPVTAHKWFNLSALRGNDAAKAHRAEIAREMSKHQIADAQRKAREWLRGT